MLSATLTLRAAALPASRPFRRRSSSLFLASADHRLSAALDASSGCTADTPEPTYTTDNSEGGHFFSTTD